MTLTYEECKALKDAGFPQKGNGFIYFNSKSEIYLPLHSSATRDVLALGRENGETTEEVVYVPTLSELIEACEERFESLCKSYTEGQWVANAVTLRNGKTFPYTKGSSPESAVCALYLALQANKK